MTSGAAEVEWRTVVHDSGVPTSGERVSGELAALFDRELKEIRGLLLDAETLEGVRATIQPNMTSAEVGFSALTGANADRLRAELFDALWGRGLDISEESTLHELRWPPSLPSNTTDRWRNSWLAFDQAHVSMMVLADGTVSYGLDALPRLADLATGDWATTNTS